MTLTIVVLAIAALAFVLARRKQRPSAGAVNGWSHGLPKAPTPQGAGWA